MSKTVRFIDMKNKKIKGCLDLGYEWKLIGKEHERKKLSIKNSLQVNCDDCTKSHLRWVNSMASMLYPNKDTRKK